MEKQIRKLQKTKIKNLIKKRIKEFESQKDWFSELCFCLLTANWKAEESIALQKEINKGFQRWSRKKLAEFLKSKGHRFWPQRAERICLARKYRNIKQILKKQEHPREWLVENIKGLGMKEASHFLRNVGYKDYAILDRHILRLLDHHNYIRMPKTLTKNKYLEIEEVFTGIAKNIKITPAELDLYMFYMQKGRVLK
jgi:N-glycosylase/DNA lyase